VINTEGFHVQYGCWKDAPDGWLNFDCSPYLRIERVPLFGLRICRSLQSDWVPFPNCVRYGDIVKGLPLPDESCMAVYCSHVLEHLSLNDLHKALANTERILKAGGIFRMVLPNLSYYIKQYVENTDADAALEFMRLTGLGEIVRDRGIKGLARAQLGNSRHRWMWDYKSLELELMNAGFEQVRQANIGDSLDPIFSLVERSDRWVNCLGLECTKLRQ